MFKTLGDLEASVYGWKRIAEGRLGGGGVDCEYELSRDSRGRLGECPDREPKIDQVVGRVSGRSARVRLALNVPA